MAHIRIILSLIIFSCTSARAGVDHDAAFRLCIAQPLLQAESLVPSIEEKLSMPHPPVMDWMTMQQILNAVQYTQGELCAAEMMDHPDVFAAIFGKQFLSRSAWEDAWVALNSDCRKDLSSSCINAEVAAAEAIRAANSTGKGQTPASRLCSISLPNDVDPVGWKLCMDIVGDKWPNEDVIQRCIWTTKWHSQADAAAAGRMIAGCFARRGG